MAFRAPNIMHLVPEIQGLTTDVFYGTYQCGAGGITAGDLTAGLIGTLVYIAAQNRCHASGRPTDQVTSALRR